MLVVLVAATAAFVLLHVAPGDLYSTAGSGSGMSPEVRATLRAHRGYDLPVIQQYVHWLRAFVSGDFGWSASQNRWVADILIAALPRTLLLMLLAFCSSLALGMGIGAWQGARAETRGAKADATDRVVSLVTLFVYSLPEFWLALALMFCFVHWWPVLPATGVVGDSYAYMSASEQVVDRVRHLALPWLSLTLVGTAVFTRFQRAAMRDAIREPFVRAARAKGSRESAVRWQAWRTSLSPVLSVAGMLFPALLGGAVFVEVVYAWQGMGYELLRGIAARDYEMIAAIVVIGSAMTSLGSLLADVAREFVDPRVRAS